MQAHSFLIESSSKLLVTRTGIKARTTSVLGLWFPWPIYRFFEMRFDLGTLDSGERSLPFGLLVMFLHMLWVLIRIEAILMSTHNICFYGELMKIILHLSPNTLLICSSGQSSKTLFHHCGAFWRSFLYVLLLLLSFIHSSIVRALVYFLCFWQLHDRFYIYKTLRLSTKIGFDNEWLYLIYFLISIK